MNEVERPYLGLRTFDEDDASRFFGREDLIGELVRMVRRDPLSVVFGVSGIGKSSLLRAGMYPAIRVDSLLPISIRLDFSGREHLVAQVCAAIGRTLVEQKIDAPLPAPSREPYGRSIADYLSATPLWTTRNRLVTPVLVFDQFEEVFTLGRHFAAQRDALMEEIAALVEKRSVELGPLPDGAPPRPRVVLSLREDYLAHLEDYRPTVPSLVSNRLRVTRMTGTQALRAVREPAGDTVTDEVATMIVRFVAAGSHGPEHGGRQDELSALEVEPSLLSLVCDELDRRRRERAVATIDGAWISEQGGEIVERFYVRAFSELPAATRDDTRALVEDQLVTADGYRTTIALKPAVERGVPEANIATLIDLRILRSELRFDAPHIELMHDRLTRSAMKGRVAREEVRKEAARAAARKSAEDEVARNEAKRRAVNRWRTLAAAVGLVAAIVGGVAWYVVRARDTHTREAALGIAQLLAEEARGALLRGETAHAADLVRRADDSFSTAKVAPPVEDALIYKRALVDLSSQLETVDHGDAIVWAFFDSQDRLVTGSANGRFKTWSVDGAVSRSFEVTSPAAVAFSKDQLVVVANDGGGEVRDLDGNVVFRFAPPGGSQPTTPLLHGSALPSPNLRGQAPVRGPPPANWQTCIAPDGSAFTVWAAGGPVRQWSFDSHTASTIPDAVSKDVVRVSCLDNSGLATATTSTSTVFDPKDKAPRTVTFPNLAGSEGTAWIVALTVSRDGNVLAAGFNDGRVDVWKTREPAPPMELTGPRGINSVDLSADSGYVSVTAREPGSPKSIVWVWRVADGHPVFAVERMAAVARWLAGPSLAVASARQIESWNVQTWDSLGTAETDREDVPVFSIEKLATGLVAVTASDTVARRVSLSVDAPWADVHKLEGGFAISRWRFAHVVTSSAKDDYQILQQVRDRGLYTYRSLHISPAGDHGDKLIALITDEGALELYNKAMEPKSKRVIRTMGVRNVGWSADRRMIAIAANGIEIWRVDGTLERRIEQSADAAMVVADTLWTLDGEGVRASSLTTGDALATWAVGTPAPHETSDPEDNAIDPSGRWAATRYHDFLLPPIPPLTTHVIPPRPISQIEALADGTVLIDRDHRDTYELTSIDSAPLLHAGRRVARSRDRSCEMLTTKGNEVYAHLSSPVTAATWTLNDRSAAAWCERGRGITVGEQLDVSVYDLSRGSLNAGRSSEIGAFGRDATFSRNGDRYAVITGDGTFDVRSSTNGLVESRYSSPGALVAVLVPDQLDPGHGIVAALTTSGISLWNKPGKPCGQAGGHYDEVQLSPDGAFVLARDNKVITLSRLDPATCALELRRQLVGKYMAFDARSALAIITVRDGGAHRITKVPLAKTDTEQTYQLKDSRADGPAMLSPKGDYVWLWRIGFVSLETPPHTGSDDFADACVFGGDTSSYIACVDESAAKLTLRTTRLGKSTDTTEVRSEVRTDTHYKFVPVIGIPDDRIGFGLTEGTTTAIYVWRPPGEPKPFTIEGVPAALRISGEWLLALDDDGRLRRYSLETHALHDTFGGARVVDVFPTLQGAEILTSIPGQRLAKSTIPADDHDAGYLKGSAEVVDARFFGAADVVSRDTAGKITVWELVGDGSSHPLQDVDTARITAFEVFDNLLVVGHDNGKIQVWDLGSKDLLPQSAFGGRGIPISHVAIDDARHWLATSSDDGVISVWNLGAVVEARRREIARFETHTHAPVVTFGAGTPAPSLLVGTADGEVISYALGGGLPTNADALVTDALRREVGIGNGR